MSLPLYNVVRQTPPTLTSDSHHGLWFDRFFNQYEADFSIAKSKKIEGKDQSPRAFWLIKSFVKNKQSIGNVTALAHYFNQQNQLIEALNGQKQAFKASWHFVTGMGNPHPVENGFAWHPTLGVPYLTGAAVKGLIRAYIKNHLDADDTSKKELLLNWFGSTSKPPNDKDYQAQGGALIFFDAIPTQPVQLGVDIMTPHMGDWYAKGASEPNQANTLPADWHDPVPVSFLVAKDITLLFSFALRPNVKDKDEIKLEEVAYILKQALQYAGAGAKTATGYGTFEVDIKTLPPSERYRAELKSKTDKQIAEMFGKDFNSTQKEYTDTWEILLETLFDLKKDVITTWATADKKSAEGKAYRKLKTLERIELL